MLKSTQFAVQRATRHMAWLSRGTPRDFAPIRTVRRWIDRSRQRRALANFDSRMLHDIGITHAQAEQECAKPFWRVD